MWRMAPAWTDACFAAIHQSSPLPAGTGRSGCVSSALHLISSEDDAGTNLGGDVVDSAWGRAGCWEWLRICLPSWGLAGISQLAVRRAKLREWGAHVPWVHRHSRRAALNEWGCGMRLQELGLCHSLVTSGFVASAQQSLKLFLQWLKCTK